MGNDQLVKGLGKVKENVDSGIFQAVQEAGIAALTQGEPYAEKFRAIYKERRDMVAYARMPSGPSALSLSNGLKIDFFY